MFVQYNIIFKKFIQVNLKVLILLFSKIIFYYEFTASVNGNVVGSYLKFKNHSFS